MRRRDRNQLRRLEVLEQRMMLASDIEFRSLDGTGNNLQHIDWGAANTPLARLTTVEYGPGPDPSVVRDQNGAVIDVVFPGLSTRVNSQGETINPRTVSNQLFRQEISTVNDRALTSFTFQWGQFLDHDLDLTEDFGPVGSFTDTFNGEDISFEDDVLVPQLRSRFVVDEDGVAQQINQISSYIDGSNVYGSDAEKAESLRAHYGGFLLTSDGVSAQIDPNRIDGGGAFLPFNTEGLENAAPPVTGTGVPIAPDQFFVAGDVRSNEQPGLTSLHTLFVREHNFQARRIASEMGYSLEQLSDPEVDESLYQLSRAIVGAEIQSITYNEFLPALFGPNQLDTYSGYDPETNAAIANVFSGSLYRVGHTMLPNELAVLDPDGTPIADFTALEATVQNGEVALSDAFFNPALVTTVGIEPYLMGLSEQPIQEIDNLIVEGVRSILFDPPAAVDLGATNLQRGRDHGLADYNQVREDFGLSRVTTFSEITSDPNLAARLALAYDGDVDNIDLFSAAISEDHVAGGSVGELISTVLLDQFRRLRDGDRFFYENVFQGQERDTIQNTRLSDVIRRNTDLTEVRNELFRADSVLTYRAEPDESKLTLRVRGEQFQILEQGRVVRSSRLSDLDVVTIFAGNQYNRIEVDSSVATRFDGSIEIHGGNRPDALTIHGTRHADRIRIEPDAIRFGDSDTEGPSIFFGNRVEHLLINSGRGDDMVTVDEQRGEMAAELMLLGGRGNDLLVGGSGRDVILGGRGRDLLVGAAGTDFLFGGRGQDILVSDHLIGDLEQIQTVWTEKSRYRDRIDRLGRMIAVESDESRDVIFGGLGRDWFNGDSDSIHVDRGLGEPLN